MPAANEDANVGVRQEWRHFKPKEKVFILKAIHTCTNAKDVTEVLTDFVNITSYINKDRDFLVACLTACLHSKLTLGSKFMTVFRDVILSWLSLANMILNFETLSFQYISCKLHCNQIEESFLLLIQIHGQARQG